MPQLEKYMFFSQTLSLAFFLFFLYVYLRKKMIPRYSTVLKYRNIKVSKWDFFTRFWHMRYIVTTWYRGDKGNVHMGHMKIAMEKTVIEFEKHFRLFVAFHAIILLSNKYLQKIIEAVRDFQIEMDRLNVE